MTLPIATSSEGGAIIGLFPALLSIGGVQEAGRLTAAALRDIASRRGWRVDFLSLNDLPGPQVFQAGEVQVSFRGFARHKLRFTLSAIGRARRFAKARPLVALAAHPNLAFPIEWIQRASPTLKTVVMSHGVEVWTPLPLLRRGALLRADRVLAPSSDTAQKLTAIQGVLPGRVRVLPWPLNPDFLRLANAPAKLPAPAHFPEGRVVLTVGRWAASERYKGADELIGAVSMLRADIPDLQLALVGKGDDLPRLRRLAAETSVADRVHFFDHLSREEVAACFARADVFALPSTGEGFGIVFLEAMAFGKPVVGAACGGTTDVIEDGINGLLVPPREPERLAQALKILLQNESLRAAMGQCGLEIVRQKYQFDIFRAGLEEVLESASGLPPV